MKKIISLLFLLLILTGACKDCCDQCPNPNPTGGIAKPPGCINFDGYPANVNAGAAWLRENGDSICDETLYDETIRVHQVDNVQPNLAKTPYTLSVTDFKNMIQGISRYGCYIGVVTDTNGVIIAVNRVPRHSAESTMYSIPLLTALKEKKRATEYVFLYAKATDEPEKIFVSIQSGKGPLYYDFSDRPKALGDKSPI